MSIMKKTRIVPGKEFEDRSNAHCEGNNLPQGLKNNECFCLHVEILCSFVVKQTFCPYGAMGFRL